MNIRLNDLNKKKFFFGLFGQNKRIHAMYGQLNSYEYNDGWKDKIIRPPGLLDRSLGLRKEAFLPSDWKGRKVSRV